MFVTTHVGPVVGRFGGNQQLSNLAITMLWDPYGRSSRLSIAASEIISLTALFHDTVYRLFFKTKRFAIKRLRNADGYLAVLRAAAAEEETRWIGAGVVGA